MCLGDDDREQADSRKRQHEKDQQLSPDAARAQRVRGTWQRATELSGACILAKHAADSRKIASIGLDREARARVLALQSSAGEIVDQICPHDDCRSLR